jgi:ATP-binding cassette subfamily F protein 3
MTLDGAAAGYGGVPVLSRLNLRIDQDDRIALLGRNGEGKSTLARLLAGRLDPLAGEVRRAPRLRIGYFAQHQIEELRPGETPLDHVRRLRPEEPPATLRARLAGFGLGAAQAETEVSRLSGGQKARLSLLIATIDAPHLLILDEPTNHLDIESRETLVEALNAYSGAVILVSHDMHLLNLVADRLWLVKGGRVTPWEGDLEAYRDSLIAAEAPPATPRQAARTAGTARPQPPRESLARLRAEVRKAEERVAKIAEMREKLSARLADPALYDPSRAGDLALWQRKFAEAEEAIARAEALWIEAQERLEAAGG